VLGTPCCRCMESDFEDVTPLHVACMPQKAVVPSSLVYRWAGRKG
jgi:hypothetical protein